MSKITKYALAAAAVLAFLFFYFRKGKEEEGKDAAPAAPPAPAPAPATPGPSSSPQETPAINSTDEPAATAIASRVKTLYNSNSREDVFRRNNTRENLFSGLQYKSGVRTVLGQILPSGNPERFPIIPPSVNPAYIQKLKAAADLEGFEELTSRGAFDLAQSLYRDVFDLSSVGGPNLWPHGPGQDQSPLRQWIDAGLFGQAGGADRNKSERFDAYGKDLQTLFANAAQITRSAQGHFEAQAIEDLNRAGWNII